MALMGTRDIGKGKAAAARLKDEGLRVEPVEPDVTCIDHIAGAKTYIESRFGRLDAPVNG